MRGGVPSKATLFSSVLVILMVCEFLNSVYTFKSNHYKPNTHQPKSLNVMFLFLPSTTLTSPSITVPLCMCLLQIFSEPLIFPLTELVSSPFAVCPSTCFHVSFHWASTPLSSTSMGYTDKSKVLGPLSLWVNVCVLRWSHLKQILQIHWFFPHGELNFTFDGQQSQLNRKWDSWISQSGFKYIILPVSSISFCQLNSTTTCTII